MTNHKEEHMDTEQTLNLLRLIYAGALTDAALQFEKEGVLDNVTARKRQEQLETGAIKARQFGITRISDVFTKLPEIFDCAIWEYSESETVLKALCRSCKMAAFAKKSGGNPCNIYCLDPMAALVKAVSPGSSWKAESTLINSDACRVTVTK